MVVELLFLFEHPRFGYEATKLDHVLTEVSHRSTEIVQWSGSFSLKSHFGSVTYRRRDQKEKEYGEI